jgi:hypothetical protein
VKAPNLNIVPSPNEGADSKTILQPDQLKRATQKLKDSIGNLGKFEDDELASLLRTLETSPEARADWQEATETTTQIRLLRLRDIALGELETFLDDKPTHQQRLAYCRFVLGLMTNKEVAKMPEAEALPGAAARTQLDDIEDGLR